MNILVTNMKKTQLTILFFLISFTSFAQPCADPNLPGCEIDIPLDSHIVLLMLFVAIFSFYSINKKLNTISAF